MPWPEQGGVLSDAVIHSRLQPKADCGFFFKNKSEADADWDLSKHTAFADAWGTAALQDVLISFRTLSSRPSDGDRYSHHTQCAHSWNSREKIEGLYFPSSSSPTLWTLFAQGPTLCHDQLLRHPHWAINQEGKSYVPWSLVCLFRKYIEIANVKDWVGEGIELFCFFPHFIQKTKQFPKL